MILIWYGLLSSRFGKAIARPFSASLSALELYLSVRARFHITERFRKLQRGVPLPGCQAQGEVLKDGKTHPEIDWQDWSLMASLYVRDYARARRASAWPCQEATSKEAMRFGGKTMRQGFFRLFSRRHLDRQANHISPSTTTGSSGSFRGLASSVLSPLFIDDKHIVLNFGHHHIFPISAFPTMDQPIKSPSLSAIPDSPSRVGTYFQCLHFLSFQGETEFERSRRVKCEKVWKTIQEGYTGFTWNFKAVIEASLKKIMEPQSLESVSWERRKSSRPLSLSSSPIFQREVEVNFAGPGGTSKRMSVIACFTSDGEKYPHLGQGEESVVGYDISIMAHFGGGEQRGEA